MTQTSDRAGSLARLRSLTRLLDNAIGIPGTPIRFGLDPIIGLLPGGGDFVAALFSVYILLEAARFGVPRPTLIQMFWNLIFDAIVGTVPFLGDLFDFTWKANTKNVALIEAHLKTPGQSRSENRWFVWLLIIGFLIVVAAIGALAIAIITTLWNAITR